MLGAGLKAGIIMGIVVAVVDLLLNVVGLSRNPILGMMACLLPLLILALWFIAGMLAARFGPATLTTGAAVGVGALAGAITQIIGGLVDVALTIVMEALGLAVAIIPPDAIRQMAQSGMPPEQIHAIVSLIETAAGPVGTCVCCVGVATVIAAALGAVGGIVGKATK
jgi:hypothetical protein